MQLFTESLKTRQEQLGLDARDVAFTRYNTDCVTGSKGVLVKRMNAARRRFAWNSLSSARTIEILVTSFRASTALGATHGRRTSWLSRFAHLFIVKLNEKVETVMAHAAADQLANLKNTLDIFLAMPPHMS